MIKRLIKYSVTKAILFSVIVSIIVTECIVAGMGFLLVGTVSYDYLITGFVASLFVSSLVTYLLFQFKIALQKSSDAALLHAVGTNAAEGVILIYGSNNTIIYSNQQFDKMYGYEHQEIIGKHIEAIYVHQADSFDHTEQLIKDGVWNGELLHRKKDGATFWVFAHISTFSDREEETLWVAFLFDISERKKTAISLDAKQKQLVEMESQHIGLLKNLKTGIIVYSADTRIIFCNHKAATLMGLDEQRMYGISATELPCSLFDSHEHKLQPDKYPVNKVISSHQPIDNLVIGVKVYNHNYISWILVNAFPELNEQGDIVRVIMNFHDITQMKNAESIIWNQANFDALTQLPNRRFFHDQLGLEIKKARRDKSLLALLYIDLDRFKEVNDTMGHEMGDLLLVEAAARIRGCIRESDTLSRLGGDEFTIILSGVESSQDIERISAKIIDALTEPFLLNDKESFISASIGIAIYPDDALKGNDLIRSADQAMYAAKGAGRSCYRYFTKAMQATAEWRMTLSRDLRRALEKSQLSVHYQPILNLKDQSIHKAEALLRWNHPEHGFISPAMFIPIAEDTGIIHEIGDWVFLQVLKQVKLWRAICPDIQIAVNKSPIQFMVDGNAHKNWLEQLTHHDLPGESIVIEITEGLLISNDHKITDKLLKFWKAGFQIAIDDFGTGYSSLAYLKKFDINYLKIDQSFTQNLKPNSPDFALCEAIVVMAHKLNLQVIAEGVETEEQFQLLKQMDCDFGQGYLFSKPISTLEFETLLIKNTLQNKQ
jgi:diguanylate cyclase (GGDEF)-like protein/PAS domain S-box-containing protein